MGPSSAFLYLGPENTRGSMAYGNGDVVSMANHLRQRRDGSSYVLPLPPTPPPVTVVDVPLLTAPDTSPPRQERNSSGRSPPTRWRSVRIHPSFPCLPSDRSADPPSQCFDKHTMTIAVWEQSPSGHEFFAHLHLHPSALSFVTELLTTLALNRMALALDW